MALRSQSRRLRWGMSLVLAAGILASVMVGQAFARPMATEGSIRPSATVQQVLVEVHRFYNVRTGTHFYTADVNEKNHVIAALSGSYLYEGVAYTLDATAQGMNIPLYRFYNTKSGTHFYTRSAEERDFVGSHYPQFNFEGIAYNVSGSPVNSTPVYRFYNSKTGAHFYTAGEVEKNSVSQNLPVFGYEGPAFYLAAGDYVEPTIEITGVADGGVYKAPAVPVVTITGATSQAITLNGDSFASGTEVTALDTYTLAVSATDAAGNSAMQSIGFTVVDPKPVISAVSISSNSSKGSSVAANGDIITLTFTSDEPVTKLGNFKINGSNPDTFTNVGNVYTATHLVDSGDPITGVPATFQINVQNAKGIYSQTIEATDDSSSVTIVRVAVVTNQAELEAALANSQIDIITFGGSFTTDAQIHVMRDVTIDGAGYTLGVSADLGTTNGSKHALSVEGAAAIITDLTIDSAGFAYGFNTYDDAVVTLENVSLLNSKGAGLTVNGSAVTASGLNTSGSAWGAINVDPGTGVTAESRLDLASGTLAEAVQIWSDKAAAGTPVVTVNAAGYTSLVTDTDVTVWSNRSYTVTATGNANGTVTPATSTVPFGTDVSITITPDAGYYLDELTLDGVPVTPQTPYVVPDVAADHAVVATFAPYAPVWTVEASPVLADVPTPGAWIKDRTAPAGFESADLEGENVLKLSVAAADYRSDNDWYNTTGRKYLLPNVQVVSADVYLPAEWATGSHRVGVWATAVDGASGITGYPIVDFFNDGTTATFRVWDNLGWHHVTTLVTYGEWYNFRIQRNANAVTYYIDGELVYESTFAADTDMATSVGFSEMILQGKNFNADDAVYFDNVVPVPNP